LAAFVCFVLLLLLKFATVHLYAEVHFFSSFFNIFCFLLFATVFCFLSKFGTTNEFFALCVSLERNKSAMK